MHIILHEVQNRVVVKYCADIRIDCFDFFKLCNDKLFLVDSVQVVVEIMTIRMNAELKKAELNTELKKYHYFCSNMSERSEWFDLAFCMTLSCTTDRTTLIVHSCLNKSNGKWIKLTAKWDQDLVAGWTRITSVGTFTLEFFDCDHWEPSHDLKVVFTIITNKHIIESIHTWTASSLKGPDALEL